MPVTINGTGTIDLGTNLKLSSSASTNVNTLDRYEEGTWTPYWSRSDGVNVFSNNDLTISNNYYVRIGNWITLGVYFYSDASFSYSSGSSASSQLYIGGLPYTSNGYYGGSICYFNGWTWDSNGYGYTPLVFSESGTSLIRINYASTGGVVNVNASSVGNSNTSIIFTLTYQTGN